MITDKCEKELAEEQLLRIALAATDLLVPMILDDDFEFW